MIDTLIPISGEISYLVTATCSTYLSRHVSKKKTSGDSTERIFGYDNGQETFDEQIFSKNAI
jgi:hypothetical protein